VIALLGGKVVLVPLLMVPLVVLVRLADAAALDRLAVRSLNEGFAKQSVLVETIGALETVKATGAARCSRGAGRRRWSSTPTARCASASSPAIGINTAPRRARSPTRGWSSSARR
jgi:ABC-type bacteriocin/lantibiotic exporter with double-glycine peptidase domain